MVRKQGLIEQDCMCWHHYRHCGWVPAKVPFAAFTLNIDGALHGCCSLVG